MAESWNEAIRQDGRLNKALTETDIKGVMGKTMDVIAKLLFPEISEKEQETLFSGVLQDRERLFKRTWRSALSGS